MLPAVAVFALGCSAARPTEPTLPMPQVAAPKPAPAYSGTPHVRHWGDRSLPTLVLIHGISEHGSADFDEVAPRLAERFHIVAFDLPGFGQSPAANHTFSPHAFADVVETVVREHTTPPVHVLGHSLGGTVALIFAGTRPELVNRLVLVDVAGVLHREAWLDSVVLSLREARGVNRLPGGIAAALLSIARAAGPDPDSVVSVLGDDPSMSAAFSLIETDVGPALDEIDAQTFVLWGRDDRIAPLRTSVVLTSRLAAANRDVMTDVGHVPMSEQPEAFVNQVMRFLTTTEPKADEGGGRSSRDLRCDGETGRKITGDYRTVTIDGCSEVHIVDARIERLIVRSSKVAIESVEIRAGNTAALTSSESEIEMTGGVLEGQPALDTNSSELDFAGVVLRSETAPILVREPSKALFSVCVLDRPTGRVHVHGEALLAAE